MEIWILDPNKLNPFELKSSKEGISQMKIMYMSEDVDVESTFVKNVEFAVRNQACSISISALILMSGLMFASYVTSPSKQKGT